MLATSMVNAGEDPAVIDVDLADDDDDDDDIPPEAHGHDHGGQLTVRRQPRE
jgi:hypothetical protein